MFSMCSELTPRARIPDTRIPQLMQPWTTDGGIECLKPINIFLKITSFCLKISTKLLFFHQIIASESCLYNCMVSFNIPILDQSLALMIQPDFSINIYININIDFNFKITITGVFQVVIFNRSWCITFTCTLIEMNFFLLIWILNIFFILILKLFYDHDFHFIKINSNINSKSQLYTLECFFTFLFWPKVQQTVCFELNSNAFS